MIDMMTIEVDKLYQEHLALARDENPDISSRDAHNHAVDWTIDDLAGRIASYLDQKYWEKQDLINKEHFE